MLIDRDHSTSSMSDLAREVDEASRATDLQHEDQDAGRLGIAINMAAEIMGVAILGTIVFLVFFNAFGRYALGFTFIWGDELVLSLLPWLGMIGMFLSIRRRQIIRIDFFVTSMPMRVRHVLEALGCLAAAASFLYLAVISFDYFQLFGGDRTVYLRIQKGWFMSAMVIGPTLAAGAYLVLLHQDLRARRASSKSGDSS